MTSQNQSSGMAKGLLIGSFISLLPMIGIGAVIVHELSVAPENTIMRKIFTNAGTSTGKMEQEHIKQSAKAEFFQEWLLNYAQQQEQRQTVAVTAYNEALKNAMNTAMEMDRQALATASDILKSSMGGKAAVSSLSDIGCAAAVTFKIPELAGACAMGETTRDDMADEIKQTLEGNRIRMFDDIVASLPSPEEFGIEPVNVEEIMKAFDAEFQGHE